MKKLAIIIASMAALSGCATYYPAPAYATRAYAQPDANGWQVTSVTPVAPGTGAAVAANGNAGAVSYSGAPSVVYAPSPVYSPAPVYAAPVYDPYWYPPVSIGLGFSFGNWCCHGGHYGGYRGGYRGGWRHR
ncbi:hypothetical protein [Massilia sp. 9096]|uniref:hypothetical protein n=1 Tax=Massilia sp. 9096 TaxID=1500894 RepID=UPI000561711E|nr:hypothetical protein [Massilia sp. 9096]